MKKLYSSLLFSLLLLTSCKEASLPTIPDVANGSSHGTVTAVAKVTPTHGTTATTFHFDGTDSFTTDGSRIVVYAWKWGDGTNGVFEPTATHRFSTPGIYTVQLTVVSKNEVWAYDYIQVEVSNLERDDRNR